MPNGEGYSLPHDTPHFGYAVRTGINGEYTRSAIYFMAVFSRGANAH